MKKIYMLFSAVLIGAAAQVTGQVASQSIIAKSTPLHNFGRGSVVNSRAVKPHSVAAATSSATGYWLNDAFANDIALGGSPPDAPIYVAGAYPLFPDTEGTFTFSNGNFATFLHLVGNVLDPLAPNLQSYAGTSWNKYDQFSIDSMAVEFLYIRNQTPNDNGSVDTMIVYLYNDSLSADLPTYSFDFPGDGAYELNFFPPGVTDTIADTLAWKNMVYDYTKNAPAVTNPYYQIIKVPLTISDTGDVVKVFATNSPFHIPAGKRAVSSVDFKPGYSYSLGDNIDATANDFRIVYAEENGTSTYPTYFGVQGATDWNVSEIVDDDARYNITADAWNGGGYFVPPYAYVAAYSTEEFFIQYHVSSFNTGVSEVAPANGVKLYQNQPNPAVQGTTLIQYDTKTSGAVNLEVTDLTGRVVMLLNQGTQSAGTHIVTMDVSGLSQGMYLYTLRTNNESVTKSMVIGQ